MKYQCNVCGAQKDLPEHASDFFVNGQPVLVVGTAQHLTRRKRKQWEPRP